MRLFYTVRSEQIKMKHTPFRAIHLCLPVMGAVLFVIYYLLYGNTTDYKKHKMILELTATVFPLLISVVVSLNVTLEEKASHFQTLLAVPNRQKILLAKLAAKTNMWCFNITLAHSLRMSGFMSISPHRKFCYMSS